MIRLVWISALLLPACGDDDCCVGAVIDAAHDSIVLPDVPNECAGPGRDKIKFARAESCSNDGGVEWCIPDNDTQLLSVLTAISPTITCSAGGGHAGCYTGGLLLCTYPTSYPDQCLTAYGEMKPEVWDDICEVAAQPQINEIVPRILD
ncbi:MAG TPA: hypothetical protein VIV40_44185 [Kofleriaceae bacterium]